MDNDFYMKLALAEARKALTWGDVPIGSVVVFEGKVIGRGFNQVEKKGDPFAHAELIAMQKAIKKYGHKHLLGCDLYVTLEPCAMCSGAIVLARINRLIIGTLDAKTGGSLSLYNIPQDARLNHRVEVSHGILQNECSLVLKDFFSLLRAKKKNILPKQNEKQPDGVNNEYFKNE